MSCTGLNPARINSWINSLELQPLEAVTGFSVLFEDTFTVALRRGQKFCLGSTRPSSKAAGKPIRQFYITHWISWPVFNDSVLDIVAKQFACLGYIWVNH